MPQSEDNFPPVPAQRFLRRLSTVSISTIPAQLALRVFVSHSNHDNDFGHKLALDLRHAFGNDEIVWYDTAGGLYGGDSWWSKIVQELSERSTFIIVLSPDSMNSYWVLKELDMAVTQRKRIIPVLYRICEVRPDLNTIQYVSFLEPKSYQVAFNELLQALQR
jgi:TIR domain